MSTTEQTIADALEFVQRLKDQRKPGTTGTRLVLCTEDSEAALAWIERLASGAWIPVTERMPESGVPVLVHVEKVYGDKTRRLRAQYVAPKTLPVGDGCEYDLGEYDEETDEVWCPEGWYETNEFEETHWAVQGDVTHWQPLPAPPDSGADDQESLPSANNSSEFPRSSPNSSASLDALFHEIRAWQKETFPHATTGSVLEHLHREFEELRKAPHDPEEQADIFFLLLWLVSPDFPAAVRAKLEKNKLRRWGTPDAAGVVEHVRDEEEPIPSFARCQDCGTDVGSPQLTAAANIAIVCCDCGKKRREAGCARTD